MPTWPASLPQFVLEQGFSQAPQPQSVETTMDTGPVKQRRRTTMSIVKFQVGMAMDQTQVATFETFWGTTLQGGTLTFDWVHPVTRVAKTFRFRNPPPTQRPIQSGSTIIVSFTMESLN